MSSVWKKVENEAGYPCYVDTRSMKQQYDHPQFQNITDNLTKFNDIKYSAYRTAFKVYSLQDRLKVPPLRICSGVLARHKLSLSESSLSLEVAELEAVLADIYFASEKEGLFVGDVDLAVDLLLNLLLNVYDSERKAPIRVLAAKTLLILLSEETTIDKWTALASCAADHNGCISPRRLTTLLSYVMALPGYLGEKDCEQHIQQDIDNCFAKNAGMLGISARCIAEWATTSCSSARWIPVLQRIYESRSQPSVHRDCVACGQNITQLLTFRCAKCNDTNFCENCYLYDNNMIGISGHKKTHLVQEIIEGEMPRTQSGFIKGVRNLFFCTKTKKKRGSKKAKKADAKADACEKGKDGDASSRKKREDKPAIFTSTVGKASGHNANNPAVILQDIIDQLESKNNALKNLFGQIEKSGHEADDSVKERVNIYWGQFATQINRLKTLQDNLYTSSQSRLPDSHQKDGKDKMQAFDIFSPILAEEKVSKVTDDLKNQPRVLSLDSGNFSVVSKQTPEELMTMSGDAMRPVVLHATSDSISTVSMNEISSWYHDTDLLAEKRPKQSDHVKMTLPSCAQVNVDAMLTGRSNSLCVTEQRYDADLRSVASSNDKMKELNADLDTVLNRLQQILTANFAMDDSCFDNTQLRETANEMEGLLGTLIRGVEQRATLTAAKNMV